MELRKANTVFYNVTQILAPYCRRFHVAGSVRREEANVKDIEIVLLPHIVDTMSTIPLFEDVQPLAKKLDPQFVAAVNRLGKVTKGKLNVEARSLQVLFNSSYGPITLDIFIPVENDYWRMFTIRTGSRDFVFKHIAGGWRKKGWCGVTGLGLRKLADCRNVNEGKLNPDDTRMKEKWELVNPNPELPPVWTSEQDFFEWLGLKWIHPKQRRF